MADVLNQGLRESIAGILDGLGVDGADTLRYAERWAYGDPVPADEHSAEIEAIEEQLADEREAHGEARAALKLRSRALRNLENAIVRWDDDRDDKALLDAWDEYRRATR